MTPLRPGVSLALFVAALLGLAAPASASTYCISVADTTGCSSFTGDTGSAGARLQAAMTAALLHAGDDTIRLGTDTYDRAPDLAPGTSATFNYGTGSGNHPSAGDLTIAGDEGAAAVIANTGTAPDDETVEGYDNTLALTLRNLTIEGPPNAARSIGLEISAPGSRVERVTIKTPDEAPTGPHALYAGIAFRQYETTVSNTVISGFAKAAFTACRAGAPGAATLEHVTIVPSGTPGTTGTLDAACDHEPQDNLPAANFTMRTPVAGNPTITVTDSILGAGATVRTDAGGAIALARTRWDGTVVGSSNVTTSGATTAAPGFFSTTDFHLLPGSALIDIGTGGGALDRDGNTRSVDGDGVGGAKPDLGAYEYQPGSATPTPTPTPDPGAPTPTPTPAPGNPTPTPAPAPPSGPTPTPQPTPQPGEGGTAGGGGNGGGTVPQPGSVAKVRLVKSKLKLSNKGRLTVKLTCVAVEPCRGKAQVLGVAGKGGKRPVLAAVNVSIAAGKTVKVAFAIKSSFRATLRKKGGKLSLAYTPRGAAKVSDTLSLKVSKG